MGYPASSGYAKFLLDCLEISIHRWDFPIHRLGEFVDTAPEGIDLAALKIFFVVSRGAHGIFDAVLIRLHLSADAGSIVFADATRLTSFFVKDAAQQHAKAPIDQTKAKEQQCVGSQRRLDGPRN